MGRGKFHRDGKPLVKTNNLEIVTALREKPRGKSGRAARFAFYKQPDPVDMGGTSTAAWSDFFPPVETYTKDGQYVVRLDLPGVDAKEVEVTAEGGILTIKGERKKAHEAKEADYQYSEVFAGRFERRLPLPQGVESEKLQARYHQGVLEVSVPLPQALTGRKIPIQLEAPKNLESKAA